MHVQMRAQSYASRSPLASTQTEINASFEKEWDRRLLTTLGVAGKRLYELRLQTPETSFEKNEVSEFVLWHACTAVLRRCDVLACESRGPWLEYSVSWIVQDQLREIVNSFRCKEVEV